MKLHSFLSRILWHFKRSFAAPVANLWFAAIDTINFIERAFVPEIRADDTYRPAKGRVAAVLVLYQRYKLPRNLMAMIMALAERGVDVITVSNGKLSTEQRAQLAPFVHRIMVRQNSGRDFGAYRVGVLTALEEYEPDRLLLLNDSVFYRTAGIPGFLDKLLDPNLPFVGATENHEFFYHVGSFALAFGRTVITNPLFARYWRNYFPTSNRVVVIKKGEMGLTKLVNTKIKVKPTVVYSAANLQAAMAQAPLADIMKQHLRMPGGIVHLADRNVHKRLADLATTWELDTHDVLSGLPAAQNLSLRLEPDLCHSIRLADRVDTFSGSGKDTVKSQLLMRFKNELIAETINFMTRGSQVHMAGNLHATYLNCPILKNDLVVRNFYMLHELADAFSDCMSKEEFEEFFDIQTRRGVPALHWHGFRKLLYDIFFEYY